MHYDEAPSRKIQLEEDKIGPVQVEMDKMDDIEKRWLYRQLKDLKDGKTKCEDQDEKFCAGIRAANNCNTVYKVFCPASCNSCPN